MANAAAVRINVAPAPLDEALQEVARQTGVDLLFDRGLVRGRKSPGVRGTLSAEDAIRRLIAGENLTVRRAASGALLLEAVDAPPLALQDVTVSEVLIVGRRTQNADIRRLETDIQPYRVDTGRQIVDASRDDIDGYFRSRVTANTHVLPRSLNTRTDGDAASEIDLRGLGAEDTLVLVDGRRMPGVPVFPALGYAQPDLNAFPLHSVDRIETLTGSAGGIYGFGALGGVINLVIDRQRRGLELHATTGISSRGDARRQALEGGFGYTSEDGRTELTLFAGYSSSDPLKVGERDYLLRDRRLYARANPNYLNFLPLANSIGVFSGYNGPPLVFKPEFGGGQLGANHTYLPLRFTGDNSALAASLRQQAGRLDISLSDSESQDYLGSSPTTAALLVNVRRQFGDRFEAYLDAVVLSNRGRRSRSVSPGVLMMPATSPLNPFTTDILLSLPTGRLPREQRVVVDTRRYTAGVLAELPFGWRGAAETIFGSARTKRSSRTVYLGLSGWELFGDPAKGVSPFLNWDAFKATTIGYDVEQWASGEVESRYTEQSVRLAGPVFDTGAGPSTLTLLAERREEEVPPHAELQGGEFGGSSYSVRSMMEGWSRTTLSFSAELRAKLFGQEAPVSVFQDLEIQAAVRRDDRSLRFPEDPNAPNSERLRRDFSGTTYTVGMKASPTAWLMVRGSYATGEQPPSPAELVDQEIEQTSGIVEDPARPGIGYGEDGSFKAFISGSPNLKTVRASTVSFGAILTPWGQQGPQLSLDYSKIHRDRDVVLMDQATILAHPERWPERIARGPLTDADRARGFTAGPITMLDARAMNAAGLKVEAIDARAQWPVSLAGGELRFYADATYYMRKTRSALFQTSIEESGTRYGPLTWRANGGFDWTDGVLTLGANIQYFGRYSVFSAGSVVASDPDGRLIGGRHVPSQTYLDLYANRRIQVGGGNDAVTVGLGVINALDASPPRESNYNFEAPGYSRYGDARRRRFELTLSARF